VSTGSKQARNYILKESYRRQLAYWAWDEATWLDIIATGPAVVKWARFQIVALGYLFGGHRRLHARAGIFRLGQFADLVFGPSAVRPALDEVLATLRSWKASERTLPSQVTHATVDLLLSCGSPHLADVSYQTLLDVVAEHRQGRTSGRRNGLTKLSRVLAHGGSSRRR
jgi:hypothetical protein